MSTTELEIPVEACFFELATEMPEATESEDGIRRRNFKGKANSGEIFKHWLFGQVAIDMETLQVKRQDLPVLRDHSPRQVLGSTKDISSSKKGIDVEGELVGASEVGRETLDLLEAGVPLQMSVFVPPGKILELAAGEKQKVNGHTMTGPGAIFQDAHLREVTITALGADENTSAAVFHSGASRTITVPSTKQEAEVTQDDKTQTPPDAAALEARHTEGIEAGVKQERERIAFIQARARGVDPKLVQEAIKEGWSKETTLDRFLAFATERMVARLERLRKEHGEAKANGVDDPDAEEFTEDPDATVAEESPDDEKAKATDAATKLSEKKILAMPQGEERWKAEFEHGIGDAGEYVSVEDYLATKKRERRTA